MPTAPFRGKPVRSQDCRRMMPNPKDRTCGQRSWPSARRGAAPSGAKPSRRMPAPAPEAVIGYDHRDLA